MKRRLFAALLVLSLLLCLLPAGASAASLSSSDREEIGSLLLQYDWGFGADFNCTDVLACRGDHDGWKTNLLTGVITPAQCAVVSRYPGDVQSYWDKSDPKGRWKSHIKSSASGVEWVLKNIFHCTQSDISKMRAELSNFKYGYYQNGYYYSYLYGVGCNEYPKITQVENYGKLYLVQYQMYSYGSSRPGQDTYNHTRYAVVGKSAIDGKSYWTLYYFDDDLPPSTGFLDVDDGAYYASSVSWAKSSGITTGVNDYSFAPARACTRAQAVTFLWRAAGKPVPKSRSCPFTDVSRSASYYQAMLWAVENGITNGTSQTTFAPDRPCTRAQIVTFLYRAAGSPRVTGGKTFSDVPAGSYYEKAVRWAVSNGITSGATRTRFSPDDPCTRAQMVTFLYRYLY